MTDVVDADVRAAGSEMRRLDRALAARVLHDQDLGLTIRSVDRDEAAAIARRHGYALEVRPVEEPGHVWAVLSPMT
jgi:hypothetical protein